MKKIIKLLNKIFVTRVEKHYYYGNSVSKNADKVWKKMDEAFDKMYEAFKELNNL